MLWVIFWYFCYLNVMLKIFFFCVLGWFVNWRYYSFCIFFLLFVIRVFIFRLGFLFWVVENVFDLLWEFRRYG